MSWSNPRWGSLIGPDAEALRAIFQSLSDWTANPTFGYATTPTISGSGVKVDPPAVIFKNEYIQSPNFVAGSAGWQIKADGNAEFNGVTVRGNVYLTSGVSAIFMKSQDADISGSMQPGTTFDGGFKPNITITAPYQSGQSPGPAMDFQGRSSIGGDRKWIVRSADRYMIGNKFEVNEIAGNTEVFGLLKVGGLTGGFGNGGYKLDDVMSMSTNEGHANLAFESITLAGVRTGVRFRQRTRGKNDETNAWVLYASDEKFILWQNGNGDRMSWADTGGGLDWRVHGSIPVLTGTTLVISAAGQIAPTTSSIEAKRDVHDLDRNPIWQMRPVRYYWKEDVVANWQEENSRLPDGLAGLLVEEVAALAPDAVHVNADGKPISLDPYVLIAYLVKAVQELREKVKWK